MSAPPTTPTADPDPALRSVAGRERELDELNIATHILDRHVSEGRGGQLALRFLGRDLDDEPVDYTYRRLADESAAIAAALRGLGCRPGDTVFLLAGRVPRLYTAALGAWRAGGVICPLFAAFGPEPIKQRLELGDARVLITTAALYRRKVAGIRAELPSLTDVILVDDDDVEGTLSLSRLIERNSNTTPTEADVTTRRDDPAILHFTSGTTGTPKGALHVHDAVRSHSDTARRVFGLEAGDVYWCTADPGWVTGTSYGLIAPLAVGATAIVDEAEFDAPRWYQVLERERVEVWYTAPTAVRMLMRAGPELARERDLSALRSVFSVGEPLSAQAVLWGTEVLGRPIRDTWWQTETGSIMVANTHDSEIRPGSMGRPVDGLEVALLDCDDVGDLILADGDVVEIDDPDRIGMLAIRPGWHSMFRDYLHATDRYRASFVGGWYIAGDLARRDADGYYWFVGRADDVIKTAGHLIGPFEVESVLNEHPDVVGAGVYGVPDAVAGAVIQADVVLRADADADTALVAVRAHARRRLGPALAPRSIRMVDRLPSTRSGKVMRRVLRARALGLPEGDTSTLEGMPS